MEQVHFGIKAAFSCTAATHTDGIEISAVLSAVQPHAKVLCEDAICKRVFVVTILFVYGSDIAPSGRTVFFTSAVISPGGKKDADTQSVSA